MGIWFYLFGISLIVMFVLVLKIVLIKSELRNIELKLTQIINSDTNALLTISSNDIDLIRLTRNLNHNLKRLRKLELEYMNGNHELREAITNISHDLRTPLTAISGYLDLMDVESLTDKQKEYVKYIEEKTNDLICLTEQLFDFTKSLDSYNVLNKEEVCLNSILENVLGSYYSVFKKSHIEPRISIAKNKVIRELDLNMFVRIMENIISNGIKYSDGDFELCLDETGVITVSNKASLLDKTSVKRIFDRYFTVENARKKGGVGLAIAKQLVELNGGLIDAKYVKGKLVIEISFYDTVL